MTQVETAWHLLTKQDQMKRSLELGRMSELEAIKSKSSPDSLAATLTEQDQMNSSLELGCLLLAPQKE